MDLELEVELIRIRKSALSFCLFFPMIKLYSDFTYGFCTQFSTQYYFITSYRKNKQKCKKCKLPNLI